MIKLQSLNNNYKEKHTSAPLNVFQNVNYLLIITANCLILRKANAEINQLLVET